MTAVQTGLLATVGAAFLAQSIICALLFRLFRSLANRPASTGPSSTGSPTQLEAKIRSLEARLARIEAGMAGGRESTSAPPESKRLRRLDRRQVASSDGPVLIAVPSLASTASATSREAAEEFDRRFGPIWALADSGTPPDEIARETGYPVGQVELILGLRRPKIGAPPLGAASGQGEDPVRDKIDA